MQTQTLTIQDARRIAKVAMRAQYGADWWKRDDVAVLRAAIGKAARAVLAQQNLERAPIQAPEAPIASTGPLTGMFMMLPEPKAPVPPVTEPAAILALRAEAHKLYPSDPSQSSKSKHNKSQAQKRRNHLVLNGAPRVQPKEGQVSFGRKLVNGVWVKLG